ncbi:MAG: hypothetical protein J0H74_14330 [Chitinophagaceae bacterium]|nr:hypothetical protein [Chitinophagaceae bacterium]
MRSNNRTLQEYGRTIAWVLLTCCITMTAACSKKGSSNSQNHCKISSIADSALGQSSAAYYITYNDNGQVAAIQQGGGKMLKTFTYTNNLVVVKTTASGALQSTDSILLNSNGFMTSRVSTDGTNRDVQTFSYSANGQIQSITSQRNGNTPAITVYQFTNGDAAGSSDGSSYSYYTDKPYAAGDYFQVSQILNYGAYYIKNAHLLKTFQSGATNVNFTYTFDTGGKIVSLVSISAYLTQIIDYGYNCN